MQAKKITPSRDSKLYELLRNVLSAMLRVKTKVIIFTKYRDTMNYIANQIKASTKYSDTDVITIDGSLNETQRYERFAELAKASKGILVATDAISEGINLQHIASQIIHYELPWNPNRLEQRNGRVDRFGQPEKEVVIRTLVMDDTLDAKILDVLVRKSNQIRDDYGFSPPYFGDETSVIDLIREHGMTSSLGSKQMGFWDEFNPANPGEINPFDEEILDRIKSDSFYGQSDLSLDFINEQIIKTHETIGTPEAIQQFVFSGLKRFNCFVTENRDGSFKIIIQHPDLRLPGIPAEIKSATFDSSRGLDDQSVEVLDLGHPLVRRLMDLIKQETFDLEKGSYGRTAAILTGDVSESTALFSLLVRFVADTTPAQIFEDLVTMALPIYSGTRLSAEETLKLAQAQPVSGNLSKNEISEVLEDLLARDDLNSMIEARVEERRQEIIQERRAIRESLQRDATWLDQAEKITLGSKDILAIKILWPGI